MDTAHVVHEDAAPAPRPAGRRRWIVALVLAAVAAPLGSGSASALGGGSGAAAPAASQDAPVYVIHHANGRDCLAGRGAQHHFRGAAQQHSPQL